MKFLTKNVILHSLNFLLKTFVLSLCAGFILVQILESGKIILPVNNKTTFVKNTKVESIKKDLKTLGAPNHEIDKLSKSIEVASNVTNINDKVLTALTKTESNFDRFAISPKKYKGLMQTKQASFKYPEVDILNGAKVLEEKLKITNGNLHKALALYKGGDNPVAKKQASEVINVYRTLL